MRLPRLTAVVAIFALTSTALTFAADQAHCVEPFSRATIDPGRDLARGTYLMILGLQYSASHRQELELLAWIGQRRGRQRPPKGLLDGLGDRSAVHSRDGRCSQRPYPDRKSTRLNSSHLV